MQAADARGAGSRGAGDGGLKSPGQRGWGMRVGSASSLQIGCSGPKQAGRVPADSCSTSPALLRSLHLLSKLLPVHGSNPGTQAITGT